jgi:hypothetical protein
MTKAILPRLYLVSHVSSFDGGEYNYAILEMNLEYVTHLAKLMAVAGVLAVEGESLYRVFYFHTGPEYFGNWDSNVAGADWLSDDLRGTIEDEIDQGEWVVMPEEYVPPSHNPGRTEAETIGVDKTSVVFKANPKHAEYEMEGSILTYGHLADVANRLMELHAKEKVRTVEQTRQRVIQLDESAKPGS